MLYRKGFLFLVRTGPACNRGLASQRGGTAHLTTTDTKSRLRVSTSSYSSVTDRPFSSAVHISPRDIHELVPADVRPCPLRPRTPFPRGISPDSTGTRACPRDLLIPRLRADATFETSVHAVKQTCPPNGIGWHACRSTTRTDVPMSS